MNIPTLAALIGADGFIGSFTGFGTSALLVPALVLWYSLAQSLTIAGLAHLLNNGARALVGIRKIAWRLVTQFALPAIASAFVGAQLTSTLDQALVLRVMGGLLVGYAAFNLWHRPLRLSATRATLFFGGAAYGFVEGLTGTGGILRAALFIAYPLQPAAFIATNAMIALIVDIARIATYIGYGTQLTYAWWAYGVFALSAAVGAYIGARIMRRLHANLVRTVVLCAILVVGAKLLIMPA